MDVRRTEIMYHDHCFGGWLACIENDDMYRLWAMMCLCASYSMSGPIPSSHSHLVHTGFYSSYSYSSYSYSVTVTVTVLQLQLQCYSYSYSVTVTGKSKKGQHSYSSLFQLERTRDSTYYSLAGLQVLYHPDDDSGSMSC